MKTLVFIYLNLVLLSLQAAAATYTVKTAGGGDFTTIQSCADAATAGDTCIVYAGTYNEVVTVSSGTAGNYKTLIVNGSDTVNVYGFILGSHTKVIGFHIGRPSAPTSNKCVDIQNATDVYVTNNIMASCGNPMVRTGSGKYGSSYVYIQGNTLSYACSTPASPNVCKGIMVVGHHQLIENNDISHVEDAATWFASYSVFRGNTVHDLLATDCGSNTSNCHRDVIESEPSAPQSDPISAHNLYEGNRVLRNIGADAHVWLLQADDCTGCWHTLIRYNLVAHVGTNSNGAGGTGILDDNAQASGTGYTHVKSYNNTTAFAQDDPNDAVDFFAYNSSYGAEKNNIFYSYGSVSNYANYAVWAGGQTGFTHGHNLAYCTGTCTWDAFYASGSGNLVGNPVFVDSGTDNYQLQAGSPARGNGSYLTTTVGSGANSTSITVADATYFFASNGITGVQSDWIRIGASTTVQIASIDYSTNAITLVNPISWSSGDPVYLYKNSQGKVVLSGSNPDIGAYPYDAPPAPPNLRIIR